MAITVIDVGTAANDGTGDPLRTAMQAVNTNFALVPEKAVAETITGAWTFDAPILASGGTAALPSISFALDPNTGIFNPAANELQFSLAGVSKFRMVFDTFRGTLSNSAALLNVVATSTVPNLLPNNQDPDTGIGWSSANVMSIIVGGSQAIRISTSSIQMNESTLFLNGSAANPSMSFIGDIDTGFMRDGTANVFSIVNGGVEKIQFHPDLTGMHFIAGTNTPAILNENGSATNPSFTPSRADPDTGLAWQSTNILSLVSGGIQTIEMAPTLVTFKVAAAATADPTIALGLATKQYVDKREEVISFAVTDETTVITAGVTKMTFRMPFGMTMTDIRASLTTAGTTITQVDVVVNGGSSISPTKLTINANETTSVGATPIDIFDDQFPDDALVTIDIDLAGTNATGLKVYIIGTRN